MARLQPLPQLQMAQPVSKYLETTGVLQSLAGQRQQQQQMAERHGLAMHTGQQRGDLMSLERQSRMRGLQDQLNQDVAVAAAWADTPEKWEQAIDHFVGRGLKDAEQFRGQFGLRDLFMRLGHPSIRDQALTEFQRRSLELKENALGLRQDELDFKKGDMSLSPTVQKILDKAQTESVDAGTQAREMELLARDMSQIDIGGGKESTFSEKLKNVLGTEEAVSDLRRRFRAFRASQAVQNLPPGVASDKDIELALSGFPSENANIDQIQSFLRGQSKLARLREAHQSLKAELISEQGNTRGLLKRWKDKLEDKDFVSGLFKGIEGISSVEDTSTRLPDIGAEVSTAPKGSAKTLSVDDEISGLEKRLKLD